ncbi:MAG: 4Fe-4S dicluster domain-containing protein [Clostridia bacterium]|nr:4Fe-4S dicluster domain-containing protein [Clostridia bacterium]
MNYWHSVTLEKDNCKGCTNCLKHCPTKAIRIQKGKAKILKERCIDCGECIRVCPYHAKKAVTDSFDILNNFKYNVALVAPTFFSQFSIADNVNLILTVLKKIGFDDVYEVACGAETVTEKTKELLKSGELLTPTISSACPAVVRLISLRFPNLIGNLIPLRSPMEVAAKDARDVAVRKTGLKPEEIGIIFISPCAAKATAVKNPVNISKSCVDGAISVNDAYLKIAHQISNINEDEIENLSRSGKYGIMWAVSGGEAEATNSKRHICVDGIHNVIEVLEAVEDGKLRDIEYVEALACTGGCVGGPLNVENNFVARSRLERICRDISINENVKSREDVLWEKPLVYRPVMNLDSDISKAMEKAMKIEEIYESLPKLDCGSCGSPGCRDLAEDIVRGYANESDCIFKLRERLNTLAKEMIELDGNYEITKKKKNEEEQNEGGED